MIRIRRRMRWSGAALRPEYGDFDDQGRWIPCTQLTPVCLGRAYNDRCTCPTKPDRENRIRIRRLLRENRDLRRENEMLGRDLRRRLRVGARTTEEKSVDGGEQ